MSYGRAKLGVCVPTLGRPRTVERLLLNLLEQQRSPDAVLVIDASSDSETAALCRSLEQKFDPGVLRYVRSDRGLTRQRRHGIDLLRRDGFEFVCMLDDDVLLEPDLLEKCVAFLESEEGTSFGGVSGYDALNWGSEFDRLERFYKKVGIFDGELVPGRWLQCGRFLQLSRMCAQEGVHEVDFLPGALTVWRARVFEEFLPPAAMQGYALGEDKHLSLRVGHRYRLGVLGSAHFYHDRAPGPRLGSVRKGFARVRHEGLMLRDCDPEPSVARYLKFLGFRIVDLGIRTVLALASRRWRDLPTFVGMAIGWLACLVVPPRRTPDSLTAADGLATVSRSSDGDGRRQASEWRP